MKNNILVYFSLFLLLFTFSGCELAGDIFKGGFYIGVIAVLLVVGLIIWLIRKVK